MKNFFPLLGFFLSLSIGALPTPIYGDESINSPEPPPATDPNQTPFQPPQQQPFMSPPPAVMDQPPPPAGTSGNSPLFSTPPVSGNHQLGQQERELLDRHKESQSRGLRESKTNSKKNALDAKAAKQAAAHASSKTLDKTDDNKLNVDYVDEPILDVLRAIATAFKLSIIPDKDLGDVKVTIHLENIPVLEGLDKLCKSHGLEMTADGNVFHIRKIHETTFSLIEMRNKRMNLDVQNRPIKDFLREFVEKTKINIVPGQDLRGVVTGHLKEVDPIDGLKALMEANNYEVRIKNGVYLVEKGDSLGRGDGGGFNRPPRAGYSRGNSANSDVDVHDGHVTLSLNNSSLGDAIRAIAEQAGLNFTIIGEVSGNVNAQLKGVTVDEALSALLQGTRYAYIRKDETLLIGDRNPNTPSGQALSGAEMVYLKYIKAENIEKIIPKSIPQDNIKVIKEQNAVLISGTSDDIDQVRSFMSKVDVPTPQVLMEVVIVEYSRGSGSDFGIGNGPAPGGTQPRVDITGSMSGIRENFQDGGFKGTIGILAPQFNMSLRALESKNKAKILAMPKITTLNGNKADLKVSRTSYFEVKSVTKDGFQNNDFRTIDDGITIELTPWITKHGEVNVTISPSIKSSEPGNGNTPGPVTNRSINTNVSLMDGETIALGGLINSKETNTREFVPILGSIPLLGYLFSWSSAVTSTNELVIYVTPHILNPEAQNVNLEEEFENLDKRSGFLKNSDFIKSSKEAAEKNASNKKEINEKINYSDFVKQGAPKDADVTPAKPETSKPAAAKPLPPASPTSVSPNSLKSNAAVQPIQPNQPNPFNQPAPRIVPPQSTNRPFIVDPKTNTVRPDTTKIH